MNAPSPARGKLTGRQLAVLACLQAGGTASQEGAGGYKLTWVLRWPGGQADTFAQRTIVVLRGRGLVTGGAGQLALTPEGAAVATLGPR